MNSSPAIAAETRPHWQIPPLERDQAIGPGVAAGLAVELGVDVLYVRIGFVVLAVAGGWGVALYLIAWLLMRQGSPTGYQPSRKGRTRGHRVAGFAMVVAGTATAASELSGFAPEAVLWPVAILGVGVAVVWRSTSEPRQRLHQLGSADQLAPRLLIGLGTLLVGVIVALSLSLDFWQAASGIIVAGLVVVGAGVLFAPVIGSLGADLIDERRLRIRSEERAEVAAHLHDSVLQTLTLIQKRSSDTDVVSLARRQERELRSWLFDDRSLVPNLGFRNELANELGEVEEVHGVPIEVVVVGDVKMTPDLVALVKATREAATNAAKHSSSPRIDVFAEVASDSVELFVRDHGTGFDPDSVASDRAGIRDSILGRMERHGGTARVHSSPTTGTEVELRLPFATSTAAEEASS